MRFRCCLASLVLTLLAGALAAEPVRTERVAAALLSEAATAAPGDTIRVGLHLEIAPGWHTYWRNPGDSGAPTSLTWRAPDGVRIGPIQWPHPAPLPYGPLVNYGYEEEVLHLVDLTLPADWPAGEPLTVAADGFWLVCADICIPEDGSFELTVPTGDRTALDPVIGPVFERFAAKLPRPLEAVVTATGPRPLLLNIGAELPAGGEAHFFPMAPGVLEHAAPQELQRTPDGYRLRLTGAAPIDTLTGVLVVSETFGGRSFTQAWSVETEVTFAPARVASNAASPSLAAALGLALLGGLLLNLMPCVLPVLSMKTIALLQAGADGRSRRRRDGIAYAAGVLATFLAVAGLLVAARAAGAQVGWGFQLQSPLVVAALAYLLFVVGLNLSGLFEINLPVATSGGGGSFMTGVLAVLVATPCTAPFMAAALGFALVQPPPVTLGVFVALGLGFALPFLLVSLVPAFARLVPRPGAWMVRLRQGLAFPMYASAAWLVWVLARQAGPDAVLAVLTGATLLAFGLWLAAPAHGRPGPVVLAAGIVATALALALLAVPAGLRGPGSAVAAPPALGEPYSPARLDTALGEGRQVLVDVTAAWCITCQVNERLALSGSGFESLLEATDTLYLVGDWTDGDPAVGAFIERFEHPGVPLYVLFPADGTAPQVLPQILTPGLVRQALAETAG